MERAVNLTANQMFQNGSSGLLQLALRACCSLGELFSGTICIAGTAPPACVLDTSQGGVLHLVTPNDECFHSCKQETFAKKLGLQEEATDLVIGV